MAGHDQEPARGDCRAVWELGTPLSQCGSCTVHGAAPPFAAAARPPAAQLPSRQAPRCRTATHAPRLCPPCPAATTAQGPVKEKAAHAAALAAAHPEDAKRLGVAFHSLRMLRLDPLALPTLHLVDSALEAYCDGAPGAITLVEAAGWAVEAAAWQGDGVLLPVLAETLTIILHRPMHTHLLALRKQSGAVWRVPERHYNAVCEYLDGFLLREAIPMARRLVEALGERCGDRALPPMGCPALEAAGPDLAPTLRPLSCPSLGLQAAMHRAPSAPWLACAVADPAAAAPPNRSPRCAPFLPPPTLLPQRAWARSSLRGSATRCRRCTRSCRCCWRRVRPRMRCTQR